MIQSVERALDILDLLAEQQKPMRSVDLASKLGLNPNTTNNLLRTLCNRGYLTQTSHRLYFPGPQCCKLGDLSDRWSELKEKVTPILKHLSGITGDCSFVGVLENFQLVCIAMSEGEGNVVVSPKQNWLNQVHCTASGKILLAYLPESERDLFIEKTKLKKMTSHTITDPTSLLKELSDIRQKGYSHCRDEAAVGIATVGVPIKGKDGRIIASLAQAFPAYFLDNGQVCLSERVSLLKDFTKELRISC